MGTEGIQIGCRQPFGKLYRDRMNRIRVSPLLQAMGPSHFLMHGAESR